MIRRPPRSTLDRSSAASDVYKRQVWSSCSPDFGVQGLLDRFGQISPTVLLAVNGYDYGGKRHDVIAKVREVVPQLPTVRQVVVIPFGDDAADLSGIRGAVRW